MARHFDPHARRQIRVDVGWAPQLAAAFGEVDEVAAGRDEGVGVVDDQSGHATEPKALVPASGPIIEVFHTRMIGISRPPAS